MNGNLRYLVATLIVAVLFGVAVAVVVLLAGAL